MSTPSLSHSTSRQRFGQATSSQKRGAALELRVRVRMHRRQLDSKLAAGAVPTSSGELGLRADQLVYGATRHHVAGSLRAAVSDLNDRRSYIVSPVVPVARTSVRRWSRELLGVADMLERPGTVDARGVARARQLVTDGSGPLYSNRPEQTLGSALEAIAAGLVPEHPAA